MWLSRSFLTHRRVMLVYSEASRPGVIQASARHPPGRHHKPQGRPPLCSETPRVWLSSGMTALLFDQSGAPALARYALTGGLGIANTH